MTTKYEDGVITASPTERADDISRAKAAYNSLVGVKIQDMTLAQLKLLLAVMAYRDGILDSTGAIKPLDQI